MNAELKAACAAATLVGVWGSAEAQVVTISNELELTRATGFYQYNSSGSPEDDSSRLAVSTLHGDLATGTHTFGIDPDRFVNSLNTRVPYTFLGVYSGGLVIALKESVATDAIANGLDWDELFADVTGSTTEAEVQANLEGGFYDFYNFSSFVHANESLFPSWDQQGVLVSFSDAAFAGTLTAITPVPEPASMAALGLGALSLVRRRRRA